MEQPEQIVEERSSEPQIGSGSILASAREKQGRAIEEIAEELNLSVSQIKSIELDLSGDLPEPTYVRGYIRAYAKLLGLNPEDVLQHYANADWQKSSNLNDIPQRIGSAGTHSKRLFSPLRLFFCYYCLLE